MWWEQKKNETAAATTNVKTAGEETDTKVRTHRGGNERKTWEEGGGGKKVEAGRKGAKKCRKKDCDCKETHECIQVCANIREWQDIFGELFLVPWGEWG